MIIRRGMEKDKIADQACAYTAVPREIMTTLEDVEQRPGAAFAYGLKNKRGEPLRSPRKSKAPFSPRKETLWGYKDTKVEHKKVPPVPLIRHKRGHKPKLHDSLTLSIRKANEPMPQTDSFVWLIGTPKCPVTISKFKFMFI